MSDNIAGVVGDPQYYKSGIDDVLLSLEKASLKICFN